MGATLDLNVVARWPRHPEGINRASGVVTGVAIAPGQEIRAGDAIFFVNERPVFAAAGSVPAYRALEPGSHGQDVAQLQDLLDELGYYTGSASGSMDSVTVDAVQAWQRASGLAPTGTVKEGDVIFLSHLPIRVAPNAEVLVRGATLVGGEAVAQVMAAHPVFTIPATSAQSNSIPDAAGVAISTGSSTWRAHVGRRTTDTENAVVSLTLQGRGHICGAGCDALPPGKETILPASITTVPTTAGVVIPVAALRTSPDGQVNVLDQNGQSHEVVVLAMSSGQAAVSGIRAGVVVRVPSTQPSQ